MNDNDAEDGENPDVNEGTMKKYVKVNALYSSYRDYVGFSATITPKDLLVISDKKTKRSQLYVALILWVDLKTDRVMSPSVAVTNPMAVIEVLLRTYTSSRTLEVFIPRKTDNSKMRRIRVTWEEVKLKKVYAHFGKYFG